MPHTRSICLAAGLALGLGFATPGELRAEDAPAAPTPDAERDAALKRAKELDERVADLYSAAKYGDAMSLARESLSIREKALGPDHPLVAVSLDNVATLLTAQGSYAEARPLCERAITIHEKILGKDHPDLATSLSNLAFVLATQGSYAEARPLFERALAIDERALGKDHPLVATSLVNLAGVLHDMGSYGEARPLYERALAIREQALGKDDPDVAQSLNNLADLLRDQGLYAEARPLLERALAIREKALGPDHPAVAVSLGQLASVLSVYGSYAEARHLVERALSIDEKALGRDHPAVAMDLSALASLLHDVGSYAEARPLYERSLAIREKALGKDHPDVATALNNLALLLKTQGAYAQARPVYERALAIREKALGKDHPKVATSLNNLAVLLETQGSYAEARPLYERALAIDERALGKDHPTVATTLNNLATLLSAQGSYAEARPLYERALAIYEKALGTDHPDVALSLNNLAALLKSQGSYTEARPLDERALTTREKALGPDHPDVAQSLGNVAGLLRALGSYEESRRLYERALSISERAFGSDHPDVATDLHRLASLLEAEGSYAEARPRFERSLELTASGARAQLSALAPSQRIALLRSMRYQLDAWLGFTPRVGLTGYPEVLRLRGLVTRAEAAERAMARTVTGDDRRLLDTLQAAQRRTARLANELPSTKDPEVRAAWQKRYAEAAAERERLTRELATRVAPARAALERLDLGLADVQKTLGSNVALVDLLRVRDRYLAWVVRATGEPVRLDVGAADAIDAAGVEFVSAVADDAGDEASTAAIRTTGDALKGLVWTAVAAKLGADVRRVVICPDAALAAVPFAALPGKAPGTALVDEFAVSYVFHPFDLVPLKDAPPSGAGALVVGGVDYEKADAGSKEAPLPERPPDLVSLDRAPHGGSFIPIPGSRLEAEELRDQLGKDATTLLLGPDASEARLREGVRGKRFVHIATHGFARTDLLAGLYDRKVKDAFLSADAERQLAVGHDPMLLSGLAFAGANPRDGAGGDDGILTALEASYLDLDGVDLVTLSACETARGTAESGEGVLGLVSAFQMAGARRVLASLWKVDDDATRRLMDGVYERMLRKENPLAPADALREAALALRAWKDPTGKARFAAPRYWAAFVAYGG